MRKASWLLFFLFVVVIASAQTQQGIVKTRGRMVNGVLKPGVGLQGATVQVKNRSAVVSGANGKFSFPLRTNNYQLESVKKNGYLLVDQEACRSYQYSANPLYLIMEEPDQQLADQLDKEKKLRRELQKKILQREDEIDALNVSVEEKNRLLQDLNQQREDNEKIIKDLSRYYSTLDYDQLDAFQQQVSDCLENGELEKADSLLRSRGDMSNRIALLKAEQEAEAKEAEELAQRQKALDASMAGTRKSMEAIAADCYNFHLRFLQAHQNDSAAHYLEQRARLDSTNVEWVNDAGCFIDRYLARYDDAISLFQLALRYSDKDQEIATCYNNLGYAYIMKGDFVRGLECYQKACDIFVAVYDSIHPDVALAYMQIGSGCYRQADYPHAEEYLLKAWSIAEQAGNTNEEKALLCNNLALLYQDLDDAEKALDYYQKALDLFDEEDEENLTLATTYNNIGTFWSEYGKSALALEYYEETLSIEKNVLGTNHPSVASSYINIGDTYEQQQDYANAMQQYQEALRIILKVMGEDNSLAAFCYGHIGSLYDYQDSLELALKYSMKAKDIRERLYTQDHPDIANSYNNLASIYDSMGNDSLALGYYKKALDMRKRLFGEEHSSVAGIYNNMGVMYVERKKYVEALDCLRKALSIYGKLLDADHPSVINVLTAIESVEYYQAIDENHLDEFLADKTFTATVVSDDTPAAAQGMSGEYILLEFADWTQNSPVSLFKKNDEYRGRPKDILVMKDGVISRHHFETVIGVMFHIKQVGREEKLRINEAYRKWKKQNGE